MLKRIIFATLITLGVAIGSISTVAAKTETAPMKKIESGTQAPQGLCPMGVRC